MMLLFTMNDVPKYNVIVFPPYFSETMEPLNWIKLPPPAAHKHNLKYSHVL